MATPDGYVLSEQDLRMIRRLLNEHNRRRLNTENRGEVQTIENEEMMTPEVYVAKTGDYGIPALTTADGTGTNPGSDYDTLGNELCTVHRAVPNGAVVELRPVPGYEKRVYNFTGSAISPNAWILTTRDKYGIWYAVAAAGGSGASSLLCVVTEENGLVGGYYTYTVQRLDYRAGSTLSIFYENCYSTFYPDKLAVGTRVILDSVPEDNTKYWITSVDRATYATASPHKFQYGYVDDGEQSWPGLKRFIGSGSGGTIFDYSVIVSHSMNVEYGIYGTYLELGDTSVYTGTGTFDVGEMRVYDGIDNGSFAIYQSTSLVLQTIYENEFNDGLDRRLILWGGNSFNTPQNPGRVDVNGSINVGHSDTDQAYYWAGIRGINGDRIVKDEDGTNRAVNIRGGIITLWEGGDGSSISPPPPPIGGSVFDLGDNIDVTLTASGDCIAVNGATGTLSKVTPGSEVIRYEGTVDLSAAGKSATQAIVLGFTTGWRVSVGGIDTFISQDEPSKTVVVDITFSPVYGYDCTEVVRFTFVGS